VPRLGLQDSSCIQKPTQTVFRWVWVKSATTSSEETWIYVSINKSDRHVQCKFHFYVKYDTYAPTYTIFSVMSRDNLINQELTIYNKDT
jgi:hypothetical protein